MLKLHQIVFTVIQFIFNLFHTAKHRLPPPKKTYTTKKQRAAAHTVTRSNSINIF